jgi:hypothetical protein
LKQYFHPKFYNKNIKIASLFVNITSESFVTFSAKGVVPNGLRLGWLSSFGKSDDESISSLGPDFEDDEHGPRRRRLSEATLRGSPAILDDLPSSPDAVQATDEHQPKRRRLSRETSADTVKEGEYPSESAFTQSADYIPHLGNRFRQLANIPTSTPGKLPTLLDFLEGLMRWYLGLSYCRRQRKMHQAS